MDESKIPGFDIDWADLYDKFQSLGVDFGIRLVTAVLIFFIGQIVARTLTRTLRKLMQSQHADKVLESFITSLVYWALMALVIIAAITRLGIDTTSFIAILGAAGLAVGLAMQGSLANFAAGVLIVVFRPYRVGDWIEAAGISGTVLDVHILTTTLKTADNKRIIVPNGQIMSSVITNYSAHDTRRVDLVFGVSYGDDIDQVRSAIKEVIDADERILDDPACAIVIGQLADSSVNFYVRPWVQTSDYWAVLWDITEAVKKRFDKEGISIPFPQRDLHIIRERDAASESET